MTKLDRKVTALAEEILKRPLSDDEELEIYRISDQCRQLKEAYVYIYHKNVPYAALYAQTSCQV
jgi:hypothetical protein